MNNLTVFENPEFGAIRTVELDGEPWLVGKDVATALGYSDPADALKRHVDDEDKRILKTGETPVLNLPNRGLTIINESGLYSLVLSSKLPTARKFRRWVTSEVLSKTDVGRIIGRTPRTVGKYLQFGGTVTRPVLSRAQLARQIAELTRYQA